MAICNTTLSFLYELAERLLRSPLLEFEEVRDLKTGVVKKYQTSKKFRDFSFSLYPISGKVFMKGSWPKFHSGGKHNYTPYYTDDLRDDIDFLSDLFDYDFKSGVLHGVEAGVNLNLTGLHPPFFTPKYLLDRMICFKGQKPFVPMKTIRGMGQGVECFSTNYRIKLYDKGMQYHLSESLLRFEYDCNQARELQSMDIWTLSDLVDPYKLSRLGDRVVKLFADCILMEPVYESALSAAQRKLYQKAKHHGFWRDLNRRSRSYMLDRLRKIIQMHSQYHLHDTLCRMVLQEWENLTQNNAVFSGLLA